MEKGKNRAESFEAEKENKVETEKDKRSADEKIGEREKH